MKKLILFFSIIILCSFTNLYSFKDEPFIISTNEIFFKSKTLKDLILNRKNNFTKKFKYQPKAITIDFRTNSDGNNVVQIITYSNLYLNLEDKKFLEYKFIAGAKDDSTIILIKNNPKFTESLFQIKDSKKDFETFYGNRSDFCQEEYSIGISNTFSFKNRLWSYELVTE